MRLIWRSQVSYPVEWNMPEVSRFYGIQTLSCYRDLPPTHFHAIYAEHEALVAIETGNIHEGDLPKKTLELLNEWRVLHHDELREDWEKARKENPLLSIAPLQ